MTIDDLIRMFRHGPRAAWHESVVARQIFHYQPPANGEIPPVNVHLVVDKDNWRAAAWALASWHHATNRPWRIVLHESGTLPAEAATLLASTFPGARLVTRQEADEKMARVLAPYSKCQAYRLSHPSALRVFDIPHFCQAQRFFLLEASVLFFREPKEMLAWTGNEEDRRCLFLPTAEDSPALPSGEARQKLKVQLLPRLNSGIGLFWHDAINLPFSEMALRETTLGAAAPERTGPALLALNACRENRAALLPDAYGEAAAQPATACYYGPQSRGAFYADGVRQLKPVLLPTRAA